MDVTWHFSWDLVMWRNTHRFMAVLMRIYLVFKGCKGVQWGHKSQCANGDIMGFQGVEWGSDHFAITKNMAPDGILLGI